jgi:hypothetical protein
MFTLPDCFRECTFINLDVSFLSTVLVVPANGLCDPSGFPMFLGRVDFLMKVEILFVSVFGVLLGQLESVLSHCRSSK